MTRFAAAILRYFGAAGHHGQVLAAPPALHTGNQDKAGGNRRSRGEVAIG